MSDKKEIEIVGQALHFGSTPQVDPEGQTVVREFHANAPASMHGPGGPGAAVTGDVGNIPAVIQYSGKAGEMANAVRTACVGCKNWDVRAMQRFVSSSEGPASSAESRQTLDGMRKRAHQAGLKLEDFGVCKVLSDWVEQCVGRDPFFWPATTYREATCPNVVSAGPHKLQVVTPAEPFGFFTPVDGAAEKHGTNRYDALLKAVQEQNKR